MDIWVIGVVVRKTMSASTACEAVTEPLKNVCLIERKNTDQRCKYYNDETLKSPKTQQIMKMNIRMIAQSLVHLFSNWC